MDNGREEQLKYLSKLTDLDIDGSPLIRFVCPDLPAYSIDVYDLTNDSPTSPITVVLRTETDQVELVYTYANKAAPFAATITPLNTDGSLIKDRTMSYDPSFAVSDILAASKRVERRRPTVINLEDYQPKPYVLA